MGISPEFNVRDVIRAMGDRRVLVENLIIRNLSYVGEHAITIAREEHARDYKDRTGNLRGSVGYVVVRDGSVVFSGGFEASAGSGTDGATGAREGRAFADQLAGKYNTGFVLIVVAGMRYGVYVERRDYDVLTFSKVEAERKAKELFKSRLSRKS